MQIVTSKWGACCTQIHCKAGVQKKRHRGQGNNKQCYLLLSPSLAPPVPRSTSAPTVFAADNPQPVHGHNSYHSVYYYVVCRFVHPWFHIDSAVFQIVTSKPICSSRPSSTTVGSPLRPGIFSMPHLSFAYPSWLPNPSGAPRS